MHDFYSQLSNLSFIIELQFKESYDLNVRWLPVTGSDSYQLNLNRDSVDYPLPVDVDTYAQDTYYIVKDIYDAQTATFPPHTGDG